jgi:hypothetical protein
MLTLADAATTLVAMLNVALVAPAATVTLAGTFAAGLLLVSATCAPPAGAGPSSTTVPVTGLPPVTLASLRLSTEAPGGTTVSDALCVPPPDEPEIVTAVDVATALVVTLKLALVAPAGIVTLAGTAAAGLLLESVTCAPPAGAAPFSVTVPLAEAPPVRLAGVSASAESAGMAAEVGTIPRARKHPPAPGTRKHDRSMCSPRRGERRVPSASSPCC